MKHVESGKWDWVLWLDWDVMVAEQARGYPHIRSGQSLIGLCYCCPPRAPSLGEPTLWMCQESKDVWG